MFTMRLARVFLPAVLFGPVTFACSAQTPDVSGNWVGVLDTTHADGSVEPGNAYLALIQRGDSVTGTAGNSPTQPSPISGGKFGGNILDFDVRVNPQMTVHFRLALQDDRLQGAATGLPVEAGSAIEVEVSRADAAWKPSLVIEHTPDRLFSTVAALDTRLFNAYNHCDLITLGSMVTDDLEFYHDKTGLSVGKQVFIDSIRNNICGKTQRTLIPGSMEVYRLAGYGAVEIGRHRFTHPGHEELGVGEAKFITVWQLKDGGWKMSREISYDHESAKN
jgi:hypothetical protein